jgi:hypothetical protein
MEKIINKLLKIYIIPFMVLNSLSLFIYGFVMVFSARKKEFSNDIADFVKFYQTDVDSIIKENYAKQIIKKYPNLNSYFEFYKNVFNKIAVSTFIYYTIFYIYVR